MQNHRTLLAGAVIFLLSVVFRLWLTNIVPQPFVYDQTEYEAYAGKIFAAPYMLAAHTYRSYPYPLMIAVLYKIVGFGNHPAVFALQAVLDSLTAVMVYFILRLAGRSRAAWIGYLLYAVNPFTAAYAGVILSEVLTTFFVAGMLLTGVYVIKKPSFLRGLLFGLCAGMAIQTRNAMTVGSLAAVGSIWFWISWKFYTRVYLAIFLGLVLTVLYPLYTNWQAYGQVSIFKVDSFYAMELYNGATLKILPPFMTSTSYPAGQQEMYREYWSEYDSTRTMSDRQDMADKYVGKAIAIIKADPIEYIRWRFFKMWYVWQKDNIFTYSEPGYAVHKPWTFWGNTMLLAAAAFGIVFGFFRKKGKTMVWLWTAAIAIIVFQTVAFSFSHAEYRLSIPLYPIIILFAALCYNKDYGRRQ